jgi:multicomponent Na+:H+ antiporter subunit D
MALLVPIASLAAITVLIGLMPGPFIALAERAAFELTHPEIYVRAVLGPLP